MSILPGIVELELPGREEEESQQEEDFNKKSFLFDFKKGDFILKAGRTLEVTQKESIKMWIEKVLRTQKNRWKIYDDIDYGCTTDDLIIGHGYPKSFLESELKREITEAVLKHGGIESLINWVFERDKEKLKISFTVVSTYGSFDQEVSL